MTPEEKERYDRIDRQLEFLAVSIASHDAQIAENWKQIAENSKQISDNSKQIAEHSEQIAEHSEQIAEHSRQIGQLVDVMLGMKDIAEEQGRRMEESQRHLDRRLDALINVVERYFSNGRH